MRKRFSSAFLCVLCVSAVNFFAGAQDNRYFAIQVIDDQTGRGVPMVQLETTNSRRYWTDSAGYIAFDEPGMMDREVFFTITSHGYEYPADGFGYHATRLTPKAGGSATIKIKRINIAERLYRMTGQGIYRDSILLGKNPPIDEPLINSSVVGQDSNLAEVYRDKIYWFWGDTGPLFYPLGNFQTTGATSDLPGKGGLSPSVGVNLHYFDDGKGFTQHMVPLNAPGPIWIDAVMTLNDESGKERLVASYSRMKDLGTCVGRGILVFNDDKHCFDVVKEIPFDAPLGPAGHPFRATVDGVGYIYFPVPYPAIRVKADWKSFMDPASYEAYTPLLERTRYQTNCAKTDHWAWKHNTPALDSQQIDELVDAGEMKRDESPFRLCDASNHRPIDLHECSICWNEYRKRYVMIFVQVNGTSRLGEVWYAESKEPLGPWERATKIVTHNKMTFYNPVQHPFFDEDGGRVIYFEGTYANTFSGNPDQTPGYDYNQMMYRLDLSDPRLR